MIFEIGVFVVVLSLFYLKEHTFFVGTSINLIISILIVVNRETAVC